MGHHVWGLYLGLHFPSLPGIAAIFSFSFVNTWNELFTAALFINSSEKMTVPVALNSFITKAGIQWNVMGAGLVVALVPTMIVFAFAQIHYCRSY